MNTIKRESRTKCAISFMLVIMMFMQIGNIDVLHAFATAPVVNTDANSTAVNNNNVSSDASADANATATPSTYTGYQAISGINEVDVSGERTQVGEYYYWIKSSNKSFKVFRSKKSKGSGSVIFKHSNKLIHTKVMGEMKVAKYAYTAIYTDGVSLVFGEFDRSKKSLTFIKRNIKKKSSKKITTIKSSYFSSYSGLGCCTLEAVYKNKCYITKQREKGSKFDSYVINLNNGKKQKINKKISWGVFDGRYIYLTNTKKATAFDCKTQKVLTVGSINEKKGVAFLKGEDGVYMVTDDDSKHRTYVVRMSGNQKIDDTIDLAYTGSYFENEVDKITKQYIYYQVYKVYTSKTSYKRYDRASKKSTSVKKKLYMKTVGEKE